MLPLLEHLFGDALTPDCRIAIFTTPSRRTRLFADYQRLAEYAVEQSKTQNVYFGVGLIRGTPRGRGRFADIAGIGCLWCDVDVCSESHPRSNLPPSLADAQGLLADLPLAPSAIVFSGHGLHAYWLLHEPWLFANDSERQAAATLAKRWHELVCRKAAARGWALENLGDLTRVLRVPGTLNHNGNGHPIEVRILEFSPHLRYDPSDFEPHLPCGSPLRTFPAVSEIVISPQAAPPSLKFAELLAHCPKFAQAWHRDRPDLADQSMSGYDLSMAAIAAMSGWTDQEIADLLIAFRRRHRVAPDKAQRRDYLHRTIAKARQTVTAGGTPVNLEGIVPKSTDTVAPVTEQVPADPGPMPEELLQVPGFIGRVMEYTLSVSPYPQPNLALAAALALQAFLAGRKIRDSADIRPHLYILALANSGAGKNEPRRVNQQICIEAGLQAGLGDAFASGEGLEDRLSITPSMLFQTDEIDGLVLSINRAMDARHEGIMTTLLKMYTAANTIYPMRVKAGCTSPAVIDQPSLCLLGTAIPQYYYEALNPRMLANGFFARLIVIEAGRRGRGQTPVARPIPEPILDVARWWSQFQPGTGNMKYFHPIPVCVPTAPEADVLLADYRDRADDRYATAEARDDQAGMAIWARASEKARKLALVYAASADHTAMCITSEAARWACRVVDHQTQRMLYMAACHVADSEFGIKCNRVIDVLRRLARKYIDGVPHWDLARQLRWSDRELAEVLESLASQQRITCAPTPHQRGKPGLRYRLLEGA